MNRRKFLSYMGCGCGSLLLSSCTTAPITDRKQLKIVSEAKLNAQAAAIYEKIKEKERMSDDTKTLNEIKEIGYHPEFWGQKGHYGVAILSKKKPDRKSGLQLHIFIEY